MDCPTCKRQLGPGEVHWYDCRAEARAERYRKALEEIVSMEEISFAGIRSAVAVARRALEEGGEKTV